MIYPLVRELSGEGFPVTVTCRVLGFSTQGYYKWLRRPMSDRDWDDAHLTNAALDIYETDRTVGYRFITDELKEKGLSCSENRVWRLCSAQRVWSNHAKKRGLNRRPGPPVHDDLVQREFTATKANELWITDITEHRTDEGKLYLCCVKDVYSNRIVGYSIDSRMKASLACSALRNAIHLRQPHGTVIHSDRGSQFRSKAYRRMIKNNGLQGSMGRVGACGDNAAMESFFALVQKNELNTRRWETREDLRLALVRWIEASYHRRRRQRSLGRMTPIEFEMIEPLLKVA